MNINSRLQTKQLITLSDEDLKTKIEGLKKELASLRVIQSTGTAPNKLSRIRVVRKGIARILTIFSQRKIEGLREKHKRSKYTPLDLRKKLTRAKRRALTPHQAKKMTVKASKKNLNFPKRRFAIIV